MFTPTLYYDTGQEATIVLETEYRDAYNVLLDPIDPVLAGVLGPDMIALDGFPVPLERLGEEVGTFFTKFLLPVGITAVGTYIAIVRWVEPVELIEHKRTYTIVVGVPFGNASVVGV